MARKRTLSPRKRPRQARSEATWTAILDAAAQLLVDQGYDKATTNRIAERAGVSVGTLYEYFPNKQAVFAALSLRWNEQRWSRFRRDLANRKDTDLRSVIRATVRARIQATRTDPALTSALRREVPPSVTEAQAREFRDSFLRTGMADLDPFSDRLRSGRRVLMAEIMAHATHAVIENIAELAPDMLGTDMLEEELTYLAWRYMTPDTPCTCQMSVRRE